MFNRSAFTPTLFSVLVLLGSTLWAGGKTDETEYRVVDAGENWTYTYDLSDREPGKYNLLVRARDAAGNEHVQGPINVFVDPASDLPTLSISNPRVGARSSAALTVIGTATDDDGVSSVEISLDDGPAHKAEGAEFFSLALDLSDVEDGVHTLTGVAVDINGVRSEPVHVRFNLDKRAPVVNLSSHKSGSLVNGRVRISGTADDRNGIEAVHVGIGDPQTPETVSLEREKNTTATAFEIRVDTREREDGPLILWFRAKDRTGSETLVAFLLVVDNRPAELTVLSPDELTPQNGEVAFYGTLRDTVGVTALRYDTSHGESGDIEIFPGDPFWSCTIDFSDAGRSGRATFIAVDAAGNETQVRHTVPLDSESDLPRVIVQWPVAGARVQSPVPIVGSIADDDAPQAVRYTVGKGEPVEVRAGSAFVLELGELDPGRREIELRGVDVHGTTSPPFRHEVLVVPPSPELSLRDVRREDSEEPYTPGFVVYDKDRATLVGHAGRWVTSVRYGIDGPPNAKASLDTAADGTVMFEIPLPRGLEPGRHSVRVEAGDDFGGTKATGAFFYALQRLPEEPKEGETYVTEIEDPPGLYYADDRIAEDGWVTVTEFAPFLLRVVGEEIDSVAIEPATSDFLLETVGQTIRISAKSPTVHGPARIAVETANGRRFEAGPFTLVSDTASPRVDIRAPKQGTMVRDEIEADISVRDDTDITELSVSLDLGETFLPLEEVDGIYPISLSAANEGAVAVLIRARDPAGNETVVPLAVFNDKTAPVVEFVTPRKDDSVNGTVTVGGRVQENGTLEALRVEGAGGHIRDLPPEGTFAFPLDLVMVDSSSGVFIVATDKAGNESRAAVPLNVDESGDQPRVDIQLPEPGAIVRTDIVISGVVFEDDAVATVYARLDEGPWRELPGERSFRLDLSLSELSDNAHVVEVKAVDLGGTESEVARREFYVSTREPVANLTAPRIDETMRGEIELAGSAHDENGIAGVSVSLDNGASFQQTQLVNDEGGASWRYSLDTTHFADGRHSVQLYVEDEYGTSALYSSLIQIDNTPPSLVLDGPDDGVVVRDELSISGRAGDGVEVDSIEASLYPLGADRSSTTSVLATRIDPSLVLNHSVSLSEVPPGWYNLQVIATDKAANESYCSRNLRVSGPTEGDERIALVSPAPGSTVVGPVVLSGYVAPTNEVRDVILRTDDRILGTTEPDSRGRFVLDLPDGLPGGGDLAITAEAETADGRSIVSSESRVHVAPSGPWVSLDSHSDGEYLAHRPFLTGRASYLVQDVPDDLVEGSREFRRHMERYDIRAVEVSLDNGRTFQSASGSEEWQFRVETDSLPGEKLEVVVRAVAGNGKTATLRRLFYLDTADPDLSISHPKEGTTANEALTVSGYAGDDNGVPEVAVLLRTGDKSRYQVPSFIQGLYLDVHALGATSYDVGAGLTFFDDNVKLQLQIGTSPPGRFYGPVLGAKLLANVASVPMSYLFGPDLDFLSLSVAVGANFSYFSMAENLSGGGIVLGGMVGQLEFPTFTFSNRTFLRKLSLYTEGQLWFISSDVEAGIDTKLSFGARFGVL